MTKLSDLARIIRSKNSGPFETTFDIFLPDRETYQRVMDSGLLKKETIAALYHIQTDQIMAVATMESALGIKITILRTISSGTEGDRDVYGAQQAAPLMEYMIRESSE